MPGHCTRPEWVANGTNSAALNPGVDKSKKGASPWSADELHRMIWLSVSTYFAQNKDDVMHDRTGWIKGTSGTKVLKGRTYKDLTEFSRPCATCNQPFSIFVTSKIAMGHADSNSFGLKNCEDHRKNKTAAQSDETDALRMANRVMKEELAGLYDRDRNQFAEIQALKAKLAGYELQGAMVAVAQNKMPWEQNSS